MPESSIIIVSTRPPKEPMSGGMAPAVRDACRGFDKVTWFALENRSNLLPQFTAAHDAKEIPEYQEYHVGRIFVRQIIVNAKRWDDHYNLVANSEVWPICHGRYDLAQKLETRDYYGTLRVNEIMAEKIAGSLCADQKTPIWVHDYHHFALPYFLRQCGVKNPIVFFNHIPLPDPERLKAEMPHGSQEALYEMISYLKEADVVNFQTAETARRFMHYADLPPTNLDTYDSARYDLNGRILSVGHFPISVDPARIQSTSLEPIETETAKALDARITAPYVFINFERCDYSKGIMERALAFEALLNAHPHLRGQCQMLLGIEPTRTDIEDYRRYAANVTEIVERINTNASWKVGDESPVIINPKHLENRDVVRLMRQRKEGQRIIGCVTAPEDGMNLVAKEFIAAQDLENPGILMLSKYIGAAQELGDGERGAVMYDPYEGGFKPDRNIIPVVRAMLTSINMNPEEAHARHQFALQQLQKNTIDHWASQHEVVMNAFGSVDHAYTAPSGAASFGLPVPIQK